MFSLELIGIGPRAAPSSLAEHLFSALASAAKRTAVFEVRSIRDEAFSANRAAADPPDLLAVRLRSPDGFGALLETIARKPRHLLLVPPVFGSLQDLDQLRGAARSLRIPVTVLSPWHWFAPVRQAQKLVRAGGAGKVRSVTLCCGPALFSDFGPAVELACQFAGYCPLSVEAFAAERETCLPATTEEREPAPASLRLRFGTGAIGIVEAGLPGGGFRAEISAEKGPLQLEGGIEDPAPSTATRGRHVSAGLEDAAAAALLEIHRLFEGGPYPDCTNYDYAIVQEAIFGAAESLFGRGLVTLPVSERTRRFRWSS